MTHRTIHDIWDVVLSWLFFQRHLHSAWLVGWFGLTSRGIRSTAQLKVYLDTLSTCWTHEQAHLSRFRPLSLSPSALPRRHIISFCQKRHQTGVNCPRREGFRGMYHQPLRTRPSVQGSLLYISTKRGGEGKTFLEATQLDWECRNGSISLQE